MSRLFACLLRKFPNSRVPSKLSATICTNKFIRRRSPRYLQRCPTDKVQQCRQATPSYHGANRDSVKAGGQDCAHISDAHREKLAVFHLRPEEHSSLACHSIQRFPTGPHPIRHILSFVSRTSYVTSTQILNKLTSQRLGHGIFSADGKAWEHSRALLRPQFSRDQVSDLDLEERHLQNMMLALPTKSDGWTEITDIQPLNFRLTMDSATEFLFGESVNSQLSALPGRTGSEKDVAFVKAFEKSQDLIAKAFRFNDWYSIGLTKEYYDTCKVCHQYINRFVEKALDHDKKEKSLETGEKERYFFLDGLAGQTQDPVEIRDQLLSILVAGRDTTASLLGFFWLMLSDNPAVFNKLRKSVIADFGTVCILRIISSSLDCLESYDMIQLPRNPLSSWIIFKAAFRSFSVLVVVSQEAILTPSSPTVQKTQEHHILQPQGVLISSMEYERNPSNVPDRSSQQP